MYSGLSGSGLTGEFSLSSKNVWSLEIPHLLQCIYSGLSRSGSTGESGLSGIKFRFLEANALFLLRFIQFSFFGQYDIHFRSKSMAHFVTDFKKSVRTTAPKVVNLYRAAGTSALIS